MPSTTETPTCAVCGLNPGEVWASGIGPTSYACCKTCLDQGAESIGVVCLRIFLDGGPVSVEKTDWGSDWSHVVKTYYEGRYIGWQEILTVYPEYEAQFKKN
jgi:hypothetical protein